MTPAQTAEEQGPEEKEEEVAAEVKDGEPLCESLIDLQLSKEVRKQFLLLSCIALIVGVSLYA